MAWDGRDLKDHQAPTPVPQAGLPTSTSNARLDQAAQGPIQPGLEHLQGRGTHSISGQPVPALQSRGKELPQPFALKATPAKPQQPGGNAENNSGIIPTRINND